MIEPLAFDVARFYDSYAPFIDFVLFGALFISLAHITIGRRLKHQGIAVALGLIMAVALAASEPALGFTIRDLGPVAATAFVLLLAYSLYTFFRRLQLSRMDAAGVAIVAAYIALELASPGLLAWLRSLLPFLGALVPIAALLVLGRLLLRFLRKKQPLLQSALPRLTRRTGRASLGVLAGLASVAKHLRRGGTPEEAISRLRKVSSQSQLLNQQIESIRRLIAQARPANRAQAAAAVAEMRNFEQSASRYEAIFGRALHQALAGLQAARVQDALASLRQCIAAEKSASRMFRKMQELEAALARLAR